MNPPEVMTSVKVNLVGGERRQSATLYNDSLRAFDQTALTVKDNATDEGDLQAWGRWCSVWEAARTGDASLVKRLVDADASLVHAKNCEASTSFHVLRITISKHDICSLL